MKLRTNIVIFTAALLLVSGYMWGKVNKSPLKTYDKISIPDGEFLRYANYNGGEKSFDLVFVTKKMTNQNGDNLYIIYSDQILLNSNKKLDKDYTKWPSYFIIDAKTGSVLDVEQHYSTNAEDQKNIAAFGMEGLLSTRFILHQKEGYVEFKAKNMVNDTVKESTSKINVKSGYPIWEGMAFMYFTYRFMDPNSNGLLYVVIPQFLKNPLPMVVKVSPQKSTMTTKAGTFTVSKTEGAMGDLFIGKLLAPFSSSGGSWVEDSDRRLIIKIQRGTGAGDESILEEISNVK